LTNQKARLCLYVLWIEAQYLMGHVNITGWTASFLGERVLRITLGCTLGKRIPRISLGQILGSGEGPENKPWSSPWLGRGS